MMCASPPQQARETADWLERYTVGHEELRERPGINKVYLTPFSGSELSQHGRGVR